MGSFLGAKTEASRLKTLQKQYQFQSMILNAKRESITAKMTGRQAQCEIVKNKLDKWNNTAQEKRATLYANDKWYQNNGLSGSNTALQYQDTDKVKGVTANYTLDAQYVAYQATDDYIDTRVENLDSLLSLLDTQIKNTEELEKNGVQDGSWWCVGGGS